LEVIEMPVITIRGQEASGAPEIGTLVAQELQIDYVDSKIIADVAAKLNRHEVEVLKKETPPRTIFGRVARNLGHHSITRWWFQHTVMLGNGKKSGLVP